MERHSGVGVATAFVGVGVGGTTTFVGVGVGGTGFVAVGVTHGGIVGVGVGVTTTFVAVGVGGMTTFVGVGVGGTAVGVALGVGVASSPQLATNSPTSTNPTKNLALPIFTSYLLS